MMLLLLQHLKTPAFTQYIQQYGYFGIYIWFISFDQLTPLPEEISLLVIGYFCVEHIFNPFLAGAASMAGFLTIDVIYYHLSKAGSNLLMNRKRKKWRSSLLESYRKKLKENMPKTLLILCFIPRVRLWGPILVGSMKLPFKTFLFYNVIGLSVFTALYLVLGMIFNRSISLVINKVTHAQNILFIGGIVFIVAVAGFLFLRRISKRKHRNKKAAAR